MTKLRKEVAENSMWNFFSKIAGKGGALVFTIIVARLLMPEGYGIYTLAMTLASFFITFTTIGIDKTLNRYLSFYLKNKKTKLSSYFRYIFKIKVLVVIFVTIIFFILSYPFSVYVFRHIELFPALIIAGFYIFIFSFERFFNAIFFSLKKVNYVTFKELFSGIIKIGLVIAIFYLISESYKVVGAIFASIFASSFALLFSLYYLKKIKPEIFEKSKEKINKKNVIKFFSFLVLGGISFVFFSYIDILMLGIFVKPEFVGFYKVSFSLMTGVVAFFAFAQVLLPYFTQFKKKSLEPSLNKVIHYLMIITIPSFFGVLVLSRYFIKILFGIQYLQAFYSLMVLSFIVMIVPVIQIFVSLFDARGKPEYYIKPVIFVSILNVILNLVLISQFLKISQNASTVGAGIATGISNLVFVLILSRKLREKLKIKLRLNFLKPLFSGIIMACILFYLLSLINDMTLLLGIGLIFIGILTYFSVLFLIKGVKREDIELVKSLIRK